MRKCASLFLVLFFCFGDLSLVGLPTFVVKEAEAATGDFSVFRNSSDTSVITTTPYDVPWDTPVIESANIALDVNTTDIDLADGGKYLVLYNVWTEEGSTSGNNRRSIESFLEVNGSPLAYGRGAGYIRDSDADLTAYNSGAAIIDVAPGDDLNVSIARDDSNTAGSAVRANTNGISVLKLDDDLDYLRIQRASTITDVSGSTTFSEIPWDTSDEVDTGSFGFTPTSGDITLKGGEDQLFLVTGNVRLENTIASGGQRQAYEMRLTLDGVEVPGSRVNTYIRFDNGTVFGTLAYSGVIKKTASGDQNLQVEIRREGLTPDPTDVVGGETALAIAALPASTEVLSLTNNDTQTLTTARSAFNWTEQILDTSTYASHSTTTNPERITIDTDDDFLFLSTTYNSRDNTGGGDRDVARIEWQVDGSPLTYGGHGSFNRGVQGGEDTYTGGSSGGVILDGLTAGQYVELVHSDETGGTPTADYEPQQISLQAINLSSLIATPDVTVAAVSSQTSTVTPGTDDTNLGTAISVVENTSSRNVTSVTLTESGTADAQTGIDNIRLYYDTDTSAPYDCTSESFSISDSQFGTGTVFSGADGVALFSDSVTISTTETLCLYPVIDVTAAASDGETINLSIANPAVDIVVTGSSNITPASSVLGASLTNVIDPELTQYSYHWRNDDGSETGATSATDGNADTPALTFSTTTPQRLRVGVYGAGTGNQSASLRLEYAEKVTTCNLATGWVDVATGGDAWDLFDSSNITNGADSTNIATSIGGLTDIADDFLTPNGGLLDTSSQTGSLTIGDLGGGIMGEYDNTTVTNGVATTINLDNTYTDPVVAVSVRYSRSTETQRTPRVVAKSATSFDVLIDNYDSSLTGSTEIDYVVVEAGDWLVEDGSGTFRIYAGTTSVSVVAARTIPGSPGGTVVTWPTQFDTQPAVFATVASNNDSDWIFASAYDGTAVANPPTDTSATVFLNENFESDGHSAAETVDIIAFEPASGTIDGNAFIAQQTGATIISTPSTVTFSPSYSSTPGVILAYHPTNGGTDGGFTQVDTDTPPTSSGVTISVDEDGPLADRGHTGAETASVVSFATAGNLTSSQVPARNFLELEYALQATSNAIEGRGYCFRVTDAGTPLRNYTSYAEATLSADVTLSATGTQTATVAADTTDFEVGADFILTNTEGTTSVETITIAQTGTLAAADTSNVRLFYDLDTSAPYNCVSESFSLSDLQFGSTVGSGFSAASNTASFTDAVTISTTSTMCLYTVFDVADTASNGDTIAIAVSNPSTDITLNSGNVGPGSAVALTGETTVTAPVLNQAGYHWRDDSDNEANATSSTGGSENTLLSSVFLGSTHRLRLSVANTGSNTAASQSFTLQYAPKVSTCSLIGSWQDINDTSAFVMASTSNLVHGNDTTNIAIAGGGVTNSATTFISSNSGQRETTASTSALTFAADSYTEYEFAIQATDQLGFETDYCFRLSDNGSPIDTYTNYAELTTQAKQDFFIQRGTETVTGNGITLVAGDHFDAPQSTSSAFIRITNTNMTGAGSDTLGSTRTQRDLTAYITATSSLDSTVTIARPAGATDNTRVSWEIIEYIGVSGGDNEIIVHDTGVAVPGASDLTVSGATVSGVADDAAVVPFITGQINPDTTTSNHNTGWFTSAWDATSSQPVFTRGDADSVVAEVSYAVVEFTGANWKIQRIEHTYTAAGVTETEPIEAIGAVSRAFLHVQKRSGDELFNLDETGHDIFISSVGAISFELENNSTNPSDQTSVAWLIENTQNDTGQMRVYQSSGTIVPAGGQPNVYNFEIGGTVTMANASIWTHTRSTGGGAAHPRAYLGARIISDTDYELWKSDELQTQNFQVEVVDWPVAEISISQNYYRLYVDNDALTPTDPWPAGASDLGENTAITDLDSPLGSGDRIRLRMTALVNNASLPASSESLKLQYARRVTTCSAASVWTDVGGFGSGSSWSGFDATPADGTALSGFPPTPADLLISVSDVAGTYEEVNSSAVNPYIIDIGEDVEYDWIIENTGAIQKSSYCFRMVHTDGSTLDNYFNYPTVRTSGYTPVTDTWRWYDDETNETPTADLAAENTAPTDIGPGDIQKLRVDISEIAGAAGSNIKFNLEYSQDPTFADGGILLTSTSSCTATSTWCYADGVDDDNATITTNILSTTDSCIAGVGTGCGTHHEDSGLTATYDQVADSSAEHEFTIENRNARAGAVYYFRVYDATNGVGLLASSSYPSVVTEGPTLNFTVSGVTSGTVTEGVTTDVSTTPTGINFGSLPVNTEVEAAQQLTVTSNATEGYKILMSFDQNFIGSNGEIFSIGSTNTSPNNWSTVCPSVNLSCFGYHVGDDTLENNSARFAADDTYAGIESNPVEVMYHPTPATSVSSDVVFRTLVRPLQPAGEYSTGITYIAVPVF